MNWSKVTAISALVSAIIMAGLLVIGFWTYLEGKFERLETRFIALESKFERIDNRFIALEDRLFTLAKEVKTSQEALHWNPVEGLQGVETGGIRPLEKEIEKKSEK